MNISDNIMNLHLFQCSSVKKIIHDIIVVLRIEGLTTWPPFTNIYINLTSIAIVAWISNQNSVKRPDVITYPYP